MVLAVASTVAVTTGLRPLKAKAVMTLAALLVAGIGVGVTTGSSAFLHETTHNGNKQNRVEIIEKRSFIVKIN